MTPLQAIAKRLKEAKKFNAAVEAQINERGGVATSASPPVGSWDYVRDVGLLLDFVREFDQFCWKHEEIVDWASEPSGVCSAHQNPTWEENHDCQQCFPKETAQ